MFGGVLLAATAGNEPTRWQRGFQKMAATPPFAWLMPYVLPKVDPFLLRVSDGDVSIPQVFTGLPVILLTTTGAKSGKERTNPVMGIQQEDSWVLIASNWGKERHPAWYYNLRENPRVTITDDETQEYVAETVTGEKREEYWEMAADLYVGFHAYEKRSRDREIPVVELTPVEETDESTTDASGESRTGESDEE